MYFGAYQFPNLMLNLHPDTVMYYIGYPKGPSHTTVVSEFLFRPETIADPALFRPDPVVEFWDRISRQDWEVCEWTQLSMGSKAYRSGGVYVPAEHHIRAFADFVLARIGR